MSSLHINPKFNLSSFTTKIYLYKFFDDLVFIYPLYAVMFADSGLNAFQISLLLIVWSSTTLLLEIPSGVLADKFSRKYILLLAQILRIVGYIIWIIIPNFTGFLLGFVFWGIKSALSSGTFEALVYDELKTLAEERRFTDVLGKTRAFSLLAILLASIGASLTIGWGYEFVLLIGVLSLIISCLSMTLIPTVEMTRSTEEKKYLYILKFGVTEVFKNQNVLYVVSFLSLTVALGGALDEFWSLFGRDVGLPNSALGIFIGLISITQAIGSVLAHKFEKFGNQFFHISFIFNGFVLLFASILFNISSLVLLLIFSVIFKVIDTVYEGKLQHSINSNVRATISSVKGFIVEMFVLATYLCFGFISNVYSYQKGFAVFGLLIILIGLTYLLLINLRKVRIRSNE